MLGTMDPDLEQEVERTRWAPPRDGAVREGPERRGGAERAAQEIGNRGFTQLVARMQDGEGILPDGLVHPDVEAAIAAARGGGRQLDAGLAGQLGESLGDSLHDVRVHTDEHAGALARAVSARAFTVGSDVFFGTGEYRPGSARGRSS